MSQLDKLLAKLYKKPIPNDIRVDEVEKIVESALKLPKGTMNITNRLAPKAKQYITLEKKPTAKKTTIKKTTSSSTKKASTKKEQ